MRIVLGHKLITRSVQYKDHLIEAVSTRGRYSISQVAVFESVDYMYVLVLARESHQPQIRLC